MKFFGTSFGNGARIFLKEVSDAGRFGVAELGGDRVLCIEEEIRRIARRKKLSVGLTDKEYVIEWLLKGIYESKIKDNLCNYSWHR